MTCNAKNLSLWNPTKPENFLLYAFDVQLYIYILSYRLLFRYRCSKFRIVFSKDFHLHIEFVFIYIFYFFV
jgi:hypothetical protein